MQQPPPRKVCKVANVILHRLGCNTWCDLCGQCDYKPMFSVPGEAHGGAPENPLGATDQASTKTSTWGRIAGGHKVGFQQLFVLNWVCVILQWSLSVCLKSACFDGGFQWHFNECWLSFIGKQTVVNFDAAWASLTHWGIGNVSVSDKKF